VLKLKKGIETRNKLLASAAYEFAVMGFESTKVDTIVRSVNVTKPAFYLYFESKQAIFNELVSMCEAKLKSEVKKIGLTQLDKTSFSSNRFKKVLENFYEFILENKDLMIIGIILNKNNNKLIKEITDIARENLETEAKINYIKPFFAKDIFADILVTNSLMLCRNYLLTGKSTPGELAALLSSLLADTIFSNETDDQL
jgi:AcrR family transcriptional regulator